ncbi:MAG: XTP/dITP diphosphatase [Clostridiales bacterium]|nr:XTP/dITP diphosphatase [Clostridiales bacterium]
MNRLIIATMNKDKLKEIKEILASLPYEVISMDEAGFAMDIEETGTTFEENAMLKARALSEATGEMVIADDSGLEVDYLDGAPGIYSARFAGEGATDADKNRKLLGLLEGIPMEKRTARFVCAIAVVHRDGSAYTVRGTCEGFIGNEPRGGNGFGYDPLFYMPEYGMTTAEMEPAKKHAISHRGRALALMAERLKDENIEG